jgi:A/G-specific adenine glycosylase
VTAKKSDRIESIQRDLNAWWTASFDRNELFPWRTRQISPYQALVTEVLLQRTRPVTVSRVFDSFFSDFPDAYSLGKARISKIAKTIQPLGLAWRAQKLKELGKATADGVPDSFSELISIPGVGPYVAGAYLSLHRNIRATIPDANSVRILARVFGFEYGPETRRKKQFLELCDVVTPQVGFRVFNYALIDLGREICTPRNPKHESCCLSSVCGCSLQSGGK